MTGNASIHATAVLAGRHGILIRGPSGSGKSRLAREIIENPGLLQVPFGRLIADDRVILSVSHGRLIAEAPSNLAGLIEIRGQGVVSTDFEPEAVIHGVIDLNSPDAPRFPLENQPVLTLNGIVLSLFQLSAEADPVSGLREILQKLRQT